jgi:glycosyltransferase involved in cell wall biosynthesis
MKVAVVYGSKAGVGGLGHSVASAITALADGRAEVHAFGPGYQTPWALPGGVPAVHWHEAPPVIPDWVRRYSWLRWRPGRLIFEHDRRVGQWALTQLRELRPDAIYLFTQVALETLRWAKAQGIPTMLDNPNGHICNFQRVVDAESQRWVGKKFHGHPIQLMVDRVEEEYALADMNRVYADWGLRSMTGLGVPERKLVRLQQTVNLDKFTPAKQPFTAAQGPLRICYAGSLDLRKGFVYLLRAVRAVGSDRVRLRIVGATGDRACAQLLAREREGLAIECAPGDPLAVYRDAELFVLPTLEDGLPFVLVEALACGLPAIVTEQAGAGECVRQGVSGWRVPAGNVDALVAAIEDALAHRQDLPAMGRQAREDVERYAGPDRLQELADRFFQLSHSRPL